MRLPTESELVQAITDATRAAVGALFECNPGHRFYYLSLTTTGEAHSPVLSAWSHEALAGESARYPDRSDAACDLKWSYADSPFYGYGEQHFAGVQRLFEARRKALGADFKREVDLRLRAMEAAVRALDLEGLFSRRWDRQSIVVNVEVMPPDATNVERAIRLNPPAALADWLSEAAEL